MILRWGDYPGLSGGPNVMTREGGRRLRVRFEEATLAVKVEEGVTRRGMEEASFFF